MMPNISITIKEIIGYFFSGVLSLIALYLLIGAREIDELLLKFSPSSNINEVILSPIFMIILAFVTYFIGHINLFISFRIFELLPFLKFNRNKMSYKKLLDPPMETKFENHFKTLFDDYPEMLKPKTVHLYVITAINEYLVEFRKEKQSYEAYINLSLCSIIPLFTIAFLYRETIMISLLLITIGLISLWKAIRLREFEDKLIYITFVSYCDQKRIGIIS